MSKSLAHPRHLLLALFFTAFLAMGTAPLTLAQDQPETPSSQKPQQPDQASPDSGGPSGDTGVIAVPRKKDAPEDAPPPAPAAPVVKNPEGMPTVNMRIEVPEVTVDVGVIVEKTHQFYAGLKPSNFRVYEDGVEQKVEGFKRTQAPITVLMLCEFAAKGWPFRVDMLNSAWSFTQSLQPQDYAAMMTFDLRTHIVTDFTRDKRQVLQGINQLASEVYMPAAFSETNIFDALSEGLDRLDRIEGQKYILLIASGVDSMSRLTLDKMLKQVKASHDITIFTVSTGGLMLEETEGRGGMGGAMRDMTYLQAENQMKTFSDMTGGMHFMPKFTGELPDVMRDINTNIRSKYELVYRPTNAKLDGTFRKIRVVLVDDEGQPLRMQDEKHKPLKYDIIARDGYRARQEVE
jgi:VWFA-related protein